ncbi:NADPH:quinone reductase [Streptomyces sp. AcH 505]|uniref:NADP-dependent oxidoreductase n=1 Tax=unclassified Streptomyces TaxID=2593676 RepID=UPI0005921FC3|nr:NADP-dependent oxidoreductase [Streptomyces sp. NBC_00370]KIF68660.1 NADPH:quinone reductase [Streptomyces sp. AcH 505]
MKAIVFDEFGGPDVLRLRDVEEPHPAADQIRILVRAAGVNPMDWKIRNGWVQQMMPTTFPAIPGLEVAGVVDEIGDSVTGFTVGDEVVGWSLTGSYAQYAIAGVIAPKPAGVAWDEAVAIPVAGNAAQRGLDLVDLREGETLLLHGAAGAVGSVAVQLAVARGATVIGTASPANHDYVRSLGAVPLTYGDGLVDRVRDVAPQGVDAVFDVAGKGALPDSIELRGGTTERIVTIADMDAEKYGVVFTAGGMSDEERRDVLLRHLGLAAERALRTQVAHTYPLAEAAKAQQTSEAGHVRGKLVIAP